MVFRMKDGRSVPTVLGPEEYMKHPARTASAFYDKKKGHAPRGIPLWTCPQADYDLQMVRFSLTAFAMDRSARYSGISVACVAWYRSDLPGHTVFKSSLFRSS